MQSSWRHEGKKEGLKTIIKSNNNNLKERRKE